MYRKFKNVKPKAGNYIMLADDVPLRATDLVRHTYHDDGSDYNYDVHQYLNWAPMSVQLPGWVGSTMADLCDENALQLEAIRPLEYENAIDNLDSDEDLSPLIESYIVDKDIGRLSNNVHTCIKCGTNNLRWKMNHNHKWWLAVSDGTWHTCPTDVVKPVEDNKITPNNTRIIGKYDDHAFWRDDHDQDYGIADEEY